MIPKIMECKCAIGGKAWKQERKIRWDIEVMQEEPMRVYIPYSTCLLRTNTIYFSFEAIELSWIRQNDDNQ